jgi:predicted ATP-grasp superfamily ATP-dependent carboligase
MLNTSMPPAVVLSCLGAPEGDLNVVRSLGERGVHVIVLSEYQLVPAGRSRHCRELIVVPGYTQSPDRLLQALTALRRRLGVKPVVFASADPDLAALVEIAGEIDDVAMSTVVDVGLTAVLSDKRRFDQLVRAHDLPVPATHAPSSAVQLDEVCLRSDYPLIVKPSHPVAWHRSGLAHSIASSKAIAVPSAQALRELGQTLLQHGAEFLVQSYIPGDDECHYDVHAYIDRQGHATASYSGRKWRIHPPHAGSGCYVESTLIPELESLALDVLTRIGYRGLANINFKRHAVTGEYKLMEINPRVSQWNILPTRSGVNLPWIAYRDACGWPPEALPPRRVGMYYLNARTDLRAMRLYRREGRWPLAQWLPTVLRPGLVHQLAQWDDPKPALHVLGRALLRRLGLGS